MGASSSSPASSCRRSSAAVHAAAAADRPSSGEPSTSVVSSTELDRLRNLPPGDTSLLSSLHHQDNISGLILTYLT